MHPTLKSFLPHLIAIACFFAAALAFNYPVLSGKALKQSDMVQTQGMAKKLQDFEKETGTYSLWTNSLFGGMPAYQIYAPKPNMLVKYVHVALRSALPEAASEPFLLMICFYFLFVAIGVSPLLGALGAFATAFSSYNFIILEVGHITKLYAIAYMAPVLAGFILLYRGSFLKGFAALALGMALELYANHIQITYYLGLLLIIFGIFKGIEAIKQHETTTFFRATALALLAIALGVGANFTNLAITYEYGQETMRGKSELKQAKGEKSDGLDMSYATNWSYGIAETATLLIPNFRGGASTTKLTEKSAAYQAMVNNGVDSYQAADFIKNVPTYFGEQPGTAGPTYFGAGIVFLFVLGLFLVPKKEKWWLFAATVLSIMLMWGKNLQWFTDLFFNYMPMYNKFRAVSMAQVIASVCVPIMAVLCIKSIVDAQNTTEKVLKSLKISVGIVGGFAAIFIIMPTLFTDFSAKSDLMFIKNFPPMIEALAKDRESMLRSDAFLALVWVVLAAGVIWFFVKKKLTEQWLYLSLIAITLIDLWSVNKRYLSADDFVQKTALTQSFEPTTADLQILQDKDPSYRVMNFAVNTFDDNSTSYFHKSLGGYNPAKLGRYEDIKQYYFIDDSGRLTLDNINVLSMFNTRYFIFPQQGGALGVQRNAQAMGNAWFVPKYTLMPNAKAEIEGLKGLNVAQTALISKEFEPELSTKTFLTDSTNSIKLTQDAPNKLVYKTVAKTPQLTVFSEMYYKNGWNAYIDGKLTPHFRANYTLRAMVVPAGTHELVFSFEPATYAAAERISLISSILLFVALLGTLFVILKR